MCKICKELTQNNNEIKIYELYENTTGCFYPEHEIIIKYCPCCGKKLIFNDIKGGNINE